MPLPKIRFASLAWVKTGPHAPDGEWYKDFGSFFLCGSGELPKTVLLKGMIPFGRTSSRFNTQPADSVVPEVDSAAGNKASARPSGRAALSPD